MNALAPAKVIQRRALRRRRRRAGRRSGLSTVARDRTRRSERAARRASDRLASRHRERERSRRGARALSGRARGTHAAPKKRRSQTRPSRKSRKAEAEAKRRQRAASIEELIRRLEEFRRERLGGGERVSTFPLRTCVGCRKTRPQRDLLRRFVRTRPTAGWPTSRPERTAARAEEPTSARPHVRTGPPRIAGTRGLHPQRQNMV